MCKNLGVLSIRGACIMRTDCFTETMRLLRFLSSANLHLTGLRMSLHTGFSKILMDHGNPSDTRMPINDSRNLTKSNSQQTSNILQPQKQNFDSRLLLTGGTAAQIPMRCPYLSQGAKTSCSSSTRALNSVILEAVDICAAAVFTRGGTVIFPASVGSFVEPACKCSILPSPT